MYKVKTCLCELCDLCDVVHVRNLYIASGRQLLCSAEVLWAPGTSPGSHAHLPPDILEPSLASTISGDSDS